MIQCATIFTDHMLLQRGKPIAVFGTGTPGETVTVSVPERRCTVSGAVGADGSWCVTLPPMPGGTGCTMTVNEQTFTDVAFGEVWLAGGQSNMEFMLKDAKTALRNWHSAQTPTSGIFPCREIPSGTTLTKLPWMPPTGNCRPRRPAAPGRLPAIWQQRSWRRPWRSRGDHRLQFRRLFGELLAAGGRSPGAHCRTPLFAGLCGCRRRKDRRGDDRRL